VSPGHGRLTHRATTAAQLEAGRAARSAIPRLARELVSLAVILALMVAKPNVG